MSRDEEEILSGSLPDEPLWSKASNLGRLEQRVTNVESALTDIKQDFRSLRDQITEVHRSILGIGKPQYMVISSFAGVVLLATAGLLGLVIAPVKDDLTRLYSIAHEMTTKLEDDLKLIDAKKLDRAAFDDTRAQLNERIAELNSRLKRQ